LVNLSVKIADIEFRNPIIIGAGTPTLDARNMIKCIKAGASAVVTKTVTYSKIHQLQPRPRFHIIHPNAILTNEYFSLYSVELMAPYPPDRWVKELKIVKEVAKEEKAIIIASIAGETEEEWKKLAHMAENAGADMIELNISCPHVEPSEKALMGKVAGSDPSAAKGLVKLVKECVSIPIIAKLTPQGANPLAVAKAVVSAGADAVVATARFQGVIIDIEEAKPILWGGTGGYGGPWMVPISCNWVLKIAKEKIGVPIIGSGGITTYEDVIQFFMVGAQAVQICTAVIVKGYKVISEILSGLKMWLSKRGIEDINEIVGKAIDSVLPLEALDRTTTYKSSVIIDKCTGCGLCAKSCFYDAIRIVNGKAQIDVDKCDGCGLCVSICPQGALKLITL